MQQPTVKPCQAKPQAETAAGWTGRHTRDALQVAEEVPSRASAISSSCCKARSQALISDTVRSVRFHRKLEEIPDQVLID